MSELEDMLRVDDLMQNGNHERLKFKPSKVLEDIVNELVDLGVYPPISVLGVPALKMVESYGMSWHVFKGLIECPHCKADLRDLKNGPPYKREIGLIHNDTVSHYECPDCHHKL